MNALPYTIFSADVVVMDDHYDQPSTKEQFQADLEAWLKYRNLKLRSIRVVELERGQK